MDVSQIRAARKELQEKVLGLFMDFQERTGLAVIGCEVHTFERSGIEEEYPRRIVSSVFVETEQI